MDKIYINGEQLDFEEIYMFSFEANDFLNWRPGTAFKSERLTIFNTPKNRRLLGNIFHTGSDTSNTFEAIYISDVIQMTGYLQIIQANHAKCEAVFYSGNGVLWEELKGVKLNEIDCSEYDHTLTVANVENSETYNAANFYMYDFCNRGARLNTGEVNIIERYPAINLRLLLGKIFEGYTLTGDMINETWFKRLFLLFTQYDQIRNSDTWLKTALFTAEKNQSIELVISSPDFTLAETQLSLDELTDNGGNFASNTYTAPETGTYKFDLSTYYSLSLGATAGNITGKVTTRIKKNTTVICEDEHTLANQITQNFTITLTTGYIELAAGDTIKIYTQVSGTFDGTISTEKYITAYPELSNTLSRYYGSGSTVRMSGILPDVLATDFLNDVFNYFALFPLYDVELRTVYLYQMQPSQTVIDLSDRINTSDGVTFELPENVNFKLSFADDGNDKFYKFAVENNYIEDGSYELDNGAKDTKEIRLARFSDTYMDYPDFLSSTPADNWQFKIPKLWSDLTGSKWATKFNLRILYYEGHADFSYTMNHGAESNVVQTVMGGVPKLTNLSTADGVNLGFAAVGSLEGMSKYHRSIFDSLSAGKVATCIVKLNRDELANYYACIASKDLRTPVYISLPYIDAKFMILKMTQKAGGFYELKLMQKFD